MLAILIAIIAALLLRRPLQTQFAVIAAGESHRLSAPPIPWNDKNLAIDNESSIIVEDAGADVGVITRADLLRTVIEGTEVS